MNFVTDIVRQYMEFAKANPVVGGVVGLWVAGTLSLFARYLPQIIRAITLKQFTMSVTIHNTDDLFYDFINWYERMGFSKKSRTLRAMAGTMLNSTPRISIGYGTHYFWYGWRLYKAERSQEQSQMTAFIKETITIATLGRRQTSIRQMLDQCIPQRRGDTTRIFVYGSNCFWGRVNEQPARIMDTIFMPQHKKDALIQAVNNFLGNRKFYERGGIPYRLGLAFHGLPGTGKTSMVRALCHYLKRDLYVIDLSKLDNEKLMDAFNTAPNHCVVLIEDIDTYEHCARRDNGAPNVPSNTPIDAGIVKAIKELGGMTLSGVLNAIDGVISANDRILIVTTNCFDKLDAALKRRGRIDYDVQFEHLDDESFRAMMKRTYPNFVVPLTVKLPADFTPVELQSIILGHQYDPMGVIESLRGKS